jgi:putative hydrolase of the HAD superfamily
VFALGIKAVLFDLGNTLVKLWIPETVYHRILTSFKINRSIEEIREALVKAQKDSERLKYEQLFGKIPYKEYWNKRDGLLLRHLGLPLDRKLLRKIQTRWFDYAECPLFPDVNPVLSKLRERGLKMGIISTAYEQDIDAITQKTGLQKELFDVIVGADTLKKTKPDPEVFKYALTKLKVKPQETLFIGDEIDADYRGAENAGIHALLIQRTENKTSQTSDLSTIGSLEEVFKYLD